MPDFNRPPNIVQHKSQCASTRHVIFAHGAGAGSEHAFMQATAQALTERGIHVWLFDFDYMAQAKENKKRRPPPRIPTLESEYLAAVAFVRAQIGQEVLWIGGKSMGGRVACHILNTLTEKEQSLEDVAGAVVIGYPFHPTAKPESLRLTLLQAASAPICICQGERDTLGNREEINHYDYPDNVVVNFFTDGDHSLKPRKLSGFTQAQHIESAANTITAFIHGT